jgi:hypothetical protein
MKNTLDIKITLWERLEFDDKNQMLDVKEKLLSGELKTSLDVTDYLSKSTVLMFDTMEEMDVNENGGMPTMEIINEYGGIEWNNA